MRVRENPFQLLGVTPENSIAEIDEAKDDKCFEDDSREDAYEAARDMLSNPRKRLSAEVRWFYEKRNHVFSSIDILHSFDEDDGPEEIAKFIQNIDRAYGETAEEATLSSLLAEINESRRKAGISQITEEDAVMETLQEALKEDFQKGVSALFDHLPLRVAAEIANEVARNTIQPSIGHFPKSYDEIVAAFIDYYYGKVQDVLGQQSQSIAEEIERAKGFQQVEELQPLFAKLKEFDFLAQPLQLYFQDKGQAKRQEESQEMAESLRELLLYYLGKGLPLLSLAVLKECLQIFAENPEMVKAWKEDEDFVRKKGLFHFLSEDAGNLIEEINKAFVRKKGYEKKNAEQFMHRKEVWLKRIRDSAAMIGEMDEEHQESGNALIGVVYYHLATACTWTELWSEVYALAKEGFPYAQKAKNATLMGRYNSSLPIWEKAVKETQASQQQSPAARQMEQGRSQAGMDQDTGCLLKLVGIIVAIGIIIAMMNSCGDSKKSGSATKSVNAPMSSQSTKAASEEIGYAEPPVGDSRTLSRDEMHWVAREKIRLEKMRALVQSQEGVEEFNKRIAHYNERGASFQYYGSSWSNAQRDVEKHRSEIEAEVEQEVKDNGWDQEETAAAAPVVTPTVPSASPRMVFYAFHRQITLKNYYLAYEYLSPDMKAYVGSVDAWARGYATTISSLPQRTTMIEETSDRVRFSFLLKAVDQTGSGRQTRYFNGVCTMLLYADGWKIDEVRGEWQ